MTVKQRYTVWVYDREKKDYVCLPSHLSSFSSAQLYLANCTREWAFAHANRDYSRYIIKRQEIVIGDYHEVVKNE